MTGNVIQQSEQPPQPEPPVGFEVRWRAASPTMRNAVAAWANDLLRAEHQHAPRARARRYADAVKMLQAMECVFVNLAAVALASPNGALAVRRRRNASLDSPIFGTHFNQCLDLAEQAGLIEQATGYRYSKGQRRLSHVRALPPLAMYLPTSLNFAHLLLLPPDDLVELRDQRGKPMRLPDTANTRRLREEVALINQTLAAADITLRGRQAWLSASRKHPLTHIVTTQHTALRRIFNGDLDRGGRLFGGWWMNLPKAQRLESIRIDGEPVAEVDWRELHPRLAYLHCGARWPFEDGADCYTAGPGDRKAWKICTNALLMARSPLNQWPGRTPVARAKLRSMFPGGTKPSGIYAAIRARHAAIAAAFECGLAGRLQRIESDMLCAALLSLAAQGIVALAEHDSLIVAARHAPAAEETMLTAASDATGSRLPVVTAKPAPQSAGRGTYTSSVPAQAAGWLPSGSPAADQCSKQYQRSTGRAVARKGKP